MTKSRNLISADVSVEALPIVIALLLLSSATPTYAWNALGHKVISEIAWRELDPSARQQIVDTLRRHTRFDKDFMAQMTDDVAGADKSLQDRWVFQQAACWPDIARGLKGEELKKYNRPSWHYVNNPTFLNITDKTELAGKLRINNSPQYPAATAVEDYNVLQAIPHARAAISSNAAPEVKALGYCWLFHLVGDLHQPLHSTSLYSVSQFPEGDRGGNSILLAGGDNLHSRWDNLLGRRNLVRDVDREVAELIGHYGSDAGMRKAAADTDPKAWADESLQLSQSVVYSEAISAAVRAIPAGGKMEPLRVSDDYMRQAGQIARRQIVIAGFRLANVLKKPKDE